MKKSLILVIAVLAIMIFALVGCSGKINADTVSATQTTWDNATNKQATDVITIRNLNFARLINVESAIVTINRKFEDNKTTIDISLDELKVKFTSEANTIFNVVLNMIKNNTQMNIDITMDDLRNILDNISEFKGNFVLTENNTKLDYTITSKVNYKQPSFDLNQTGSVTINTDEEFGDAIGQSMNMLSSHFSSVFEPTTDGGARINPTKINSILTAFIDYQEANDPDKDTDGYKPISKQIYDVLGITYNQFISKRIKVNSSNNQCKVKKNFITEMKITLSKVQLLYNKEQLTEVITKAVTIISPENASGIGAIKTFLKDVTEGVSCLETETIMINSTYKINK